MPSDDDNDIWQSVAADVKPLKGRRATPRILSAEELAKKPMKFKPAKTRGIMRRLYDAKLDLHGLTENGAHKLLLEFFEHQRKRGARRLLVITGKGTSGAGALRTNVPRWLDVEPLMRSITLIEIAPPNLGGDGAYLIHLKKPRP